MNSRGRLLVVSNRLPITADGRQSDGGLVSALLPLVRESHGCWVGWTGTDIDLALSGRIKDWAAAHGCACEPVFLTAAEKQAFYQGYSNEILWPLFHGFPSRCNFDASYWAGYCRANEKFADAVRDVAEPGDFIWVHDYHLMPQARMLRARGVRNRVAYFHHIPFPSPDVFEALPRRSELLHALMGYDVIGFQTERDRRNFAACVRRWTAGLQARPVLLTSPISIDSDAFEAESETLQVTAAAELIRERLAETQIILGVDRLDYTKGIPQRLMAFETLLRGRPELKGKVTMVQVVVPSRENIPEYAQLKLRIEMLVSKINGEYGGPGWAPVQYFHRSISRTELIAFYRAAAVALVTPLRDGMNLVAKEFCASRTDDRGVLVLSEFAGAAEELRGGALLVNPNDVEGVAASLVEALTMDDVEQQARMSALRSQIREHNIFRWARGFYNRHNEVVIKDDVIELRDAHVRGEALNS